MLTLLTAAALLIPLPCRADTTKLVYALPVSVPAAIAYVAIDQGFFKEEGLDVEAKMFSSGREALQALLAGQAQLQTVSETPVVHAIVQGNPLVTIATISEHGEAKILARTDHGVRKPADLRGKNVATLPGTNSDYFMYKFLAANGLKVEDVHIANMSPPEMLISLAKGDIDAIFAWEPHVYYGRRQLPKETVVFYPGDLYRGRSTVNMNPDFARSHPETVRAVVRGLLKAEAYVAKHPNESAILVAKRLNMDVDALKALMKENVYRVELERGLLDIMRSIGDWAMKMKGLTGASPDFRSHLYDAALRAERPSAVKL